MNNLLLKSHNICICFGNFCQNVYQNTTITIGVQKLTLKDGGRVCIGSKKFGPKHFPHRKIFCWFIAELNQ